MCRAYSPVACCRLKGRRWETEAAFALSARARMRTIVYVDGFNLYYRMLERRPDLKWLNIKQVAEKTLRAENRIIGVRYYAARISGRIDPSAPARQQVYLDALSTIPKLSFHMGNFLSSTKFAGLVHPPTFRPVLAHQIPQPWPAVVRVHKTEEKGSDVNLASHLLLGAFRNNFDVAAVLSTTPTLSNPFASSPKIWAKSSASFRLFPIPRPNCKRSRVSCGA